MKIVNGIPKHTQSFREKLWSWVESKFKKENQQPAIKAPSNEPYTNYSLFAKELNYYYTGLYRGTFFLNYLLAIVAVTLAALTLVVLGKGHTSSADALKPYLPPSTLVTASESGAKRPNSDNAKTDENKTGDAKDDEKTASHNDHASEEIPYHLLIILGGLKLGVVYCIYHNTH